MFAIVKIGGNQYKVKLGDKLDVSRLEGEVGETLVYPALLVAGDEKVTVGPDAAKLSVVLKINQHLRGEKLDVYRFRAKSRHRRHIGFRAEKTIVSVESIAGKTLHAAEEKKVERKPKSVKKVTPPKKLAKKSS